MEISIISQKKSLSIKEPPAAAKTATADDRVSNWWKIELRKFIPPVAIFHFLTRWYMTGQSAVTDKRTKIYLSDRTNTQNEFHLCLSVVWVFFWSDRGLYQNKTKKKMSQYLKLAPTQSETERWRSVKTKKKCRAKRAYEKLKLENSSLSSFPARRGGGETVDGAAVRLLAKWNVNMKSQLELLTVVLRGRKVCVYFWKLTWRNFFGMYTAVHSHE